MEVKRQVIVKTLLKHRTLFPESSIPRILRAISIQEGKLLFYYTKQPFSLNASLVAFKEPKKLLWRSADPFWQTEQEIKPKAITMEKRIIHFHYIANGKYKIIKFTINDILDWKPKKVTPAALERIPINPILKPNPTNQWESLAVFNTAALYLDGKVHLIYRAIGEDGLSNFGYASSEDGIHIDKRLHEPVLVAETSQDIDKQQQLLSSQSYQSGINWGGYEDPRLSKVDDTIYMSYTTYDGMHPPGVALTSIKQSDFLKQKWNWQKPVLLSSPQEAHKNWVIFPEKIKGKYAILHSLTPEVLIDYRDSLNFKKNTLINSHYQSSGREEQWDNSMRGVGTPPIKTSEGWLVLYHAMDKKDPDRYKIGAMLLDLNDPTKIIYRSSAPLLEPDATYENIGFKSGVVYTCGALVIDETLYVYYGGADTVICAAFINLKELLSQLKDLRCHSLRKVLIPVRKKKRLSICMI